MSFTTVVWGILNFLAERPGAVQSETAFAGGAMSQ